MYALRFSPPTQREISANAAKFATLPLLWQRRARPLALRELPGLRL
jgi:hypothetical protein